MLRQGDVLLIRRDDVDLTNAEKIEPKEGYAVLAEGETSGHAHRVAAVLATFYLLEQMRLLQVHKPTTVQHEEHGALELDPGLYEVRRQQEYTPRGLRQVAD